LRIRLGRRLSGFDLVELATLALLAVLACWTMAWLIVRAVHRHEVWTGADGLHPTDQLQYMAWIRSAGASVLISDRFVIRATPHTFLHPLFLLSGLVYDAGVPAWLVNLLWEPIAVAALFFGVRAYAHRLIPTAGGRRAALVLALFFVSTAAFLASELGAGGKAQLYLTALEVELWPGTWLWGYAFTVLAVAAMPIGLLLYERDRSRGRAGVGAAFAFALCSWLQPWQGATLLGILTVSEAVCRVPARDRSQLRLALLTLSAGVLPLLYYAVLGKSDPWWALAGRANQIPGWPVWAVLATIAPLALPALLAYRRRPRTFAEISVRAWPVCGLAVYWVMALGHIGTFAIHSFQGLTIPLGILAVLGLQELWARLPLGPRPLWVLSVVLLGFFTVPAFAWNLRDAERSTRSDTVAVGPPTPYFLTQGESNAVRFLAHSPLSGGVLTDAEFGEVVPARTDRHVWLGLPSWTPTYAARSQLASSLFSGALSPSASRTFVAATGARFVFVSCEDTPLLGARIRPLVLAQRRFGCATVLRLRPASNRTPGTRG
jgi:hypothetical protein